MPLKRSTYNNKKFIYRIINILIVGLKNNKTIINI